MAGIYSALAELIKANKPAALATAIAGEQIGSKLLVSGGQIVGGSIRSTVGRSHS